MPQLSTLIQQLPSHADAKISTSGSVLWITWLDNELDNAIGQVLQDYGGIPIISDVRQAAWFFFTSDVMLALARIDSWGKFNQRQVLLQLIPGTLRIESAKNFTISVPEEFLPQDLTPVDGLQIRIHNSVREATMGILGITFIEVEPVGNMTTGPWFNLKADTRIPHNSSLNWYCVLKPLGNPLEKSFQQGWRNFFGELESILKRNKFKYILQDNFLILPLEGLRSLRTWCRDLLHCINEIRNEKPESFWPCVSAIVERKSLSFNNELPKKIPLDWDQIVPDMPYMNYRTGYLLGDGFSVHPTGLRSNKTNIESWCTVTLSREETKQGAIPLLVASHISSGSFPHCFYCGMRNHDTPHCPTRGLESLTPNVWREVATLDFPAMNKGLKIVAAQMSEFGVHDSFNRLFNVNTIGGTVTRAMFDVNATLQHRMARRMWIARGREYPRGLDETAPKDEHPLWGALDNFKTGDLHASEREVAALLIKSPRDYRVRTLQGFIALERVDYPRAQSVWREAVSFCTTALQSAWIYFLLGRLNEVTNKLVVASQYYSEALQRCPLWYEASYRQAVCLIKQGFAEQGTHKLLALLHYEPHIFNKALLDPELERGQLHILAEFYTPFNESSQRVDEEKLSLQGLRNEVIMWFGEKHPFAQSARERINNIMNMADIKNYVPMQAVIHGRTNLEKDLQNRVNRETRDLKNRFKYFMDRLKFIRDEAAWFPFPKILIEFNKTYNQCATNLNWAIQTQFTTPEAFRQAHEIAKEEQGRIRTLDKRLRFLRIVRDSTLFVLIMGKTFLWLEILGLVLVLIALPLLLHFGDQIGLSWVTHQIANERWALQKILILGLSTFALCVGALRTIAVFDKQRNLLFEDAKRIEKEASALRSAATERKMGM